MKILRPSGRGSRYPDDPRSARLAGEPDDGRSVRLLVQKATGHVLGAIVVLAEERHEVG